jgi:hypothetical protein
MTKLNINLLVADLIDADNADLRYIANRLVARNPDQAAMLADFLSSYIQIFDMKNAREAVES